MLGGDRGSKYLAPRAFVARERCASALLEYYQRGGHKRGSPVFEQRHDILVKYDVAERDIAHLELGGLIAVASNTGPTAFWVLYEVFSNPSLLEELRADLDASTVRTVSEHGRPVYTFDFSIAKQTSPLLLAIFQESLRFHSSGQQNREVMEDTVLDGKYLLKKGALVQMPSNTVHTDSAVWGPDVHEFQPRRFLNRQKPGSFRGFGGGVTLCPGRHFATNEILVMVSLMVLRYDLQPTGGGEWPRLKHAKANVTTAVSLPAQDLEVEALPRKGFENVEWRFELSDSKSRVDMGGVA